ncbi:MAG TPA: hypothetical protein VMZ91_10405 [Candidatus Paceibacterota bacterium]|nr:hypothetical protein [Candidatus Paceibacterota bacterium]
MEKVQMLAVFDGLNTKKDGLHVIKFRIALREITNYLQTVRFIGRNAKVGIKQGGEKILLTKSASFYRLTIDSGGEAVFTIEAEDIAKDFNAKSIIDKVIILVIWEDE